MKHYVRATAEDFKKAANQESSFAPKVAPEPACIEGNEAELLPRLLPSGTTEKPAKHCKPNKKRASGEISLARSVDDIGLQHQWKTRGKLRWAAMVVRRVVQDGPKFGS